jgi:hypothetical protein
MAPVRTFGLAALVVGVVLVAIAYQSAHAPADQITNLLTGRFTDKTMWYAIVGVMAVVLGGATAAFGVRR